MGEKIRDGNRIHVGAKNKRLGRARVERAPHHVSWIELTSPSPSPSRVSGENCCLRCTGSVMKEAGRSRALDLIHLNISDWVLHRSTPSGYHLRANRVSHSPTPIPLFIKGRVKYLSSKSGGAKYGRIRIPPTDAPIIPFFFPLELGSQFRINKISRGTFRIVPGILRNQLLDRTCTHTRHYHLLRLL